MIGLGRSIIGKDNTCSSGKGLLIFLRKIKKTADSYLGEEVKEPGIHSFLAYL